MNFKDLTSNDIDYAKGIYQDKSLSWDDRMNILVKFFGKSERTVRKWCSERLGFKEKVEIEWKSFQLDPTTKSQPGKSNYDYLAEINEDDD